MPFDRNTLAELIERSQSIIESKLDGADAGIVNGVLDVLAYINATSEHALESFLSYISKQALVDTAEDEFLDRHGDIFNVNKGQAEKASGDADIAGVNASVVLAGEILTIDLVSYVVTVGATIIGGVATITVQAVNAGLDGNALEGETISFNSPPSGIDTAALVAAGDIIGGVNVDSPEVYRDAIVDRIRNAPSGGNEKDFEVWALEVPGVTRAWIFPLEDGLGTVRIRFVMDDTYPDGIPQAGDIADVKAYIEDPTRAPATATIFVSAPTVQTEVFTIAITPDTPAIRTAVETEIDDLFRSDGGPGGTIRLSKIHEAISRAQGEDFHTLTVPAADITVANDKLAVRGVITWS